MSNSHKNSAKKPKPPQKASQNSVAGSTSHRNAASQVPAALHAPGALQVPDELRLRLRGNGEWQAYASKSAGEFYLSPEILFLLQAIQREANSSAMQAIPAKGKPSRPSQQKASSKFQADALKILKNTLSAFPQISETEALIEELVDCGILHRSLAGEGNNLEATNRNLLQDGFGDPWIQWAMLADTQRCHAYEEALRRAIHKQSVVVDIGAGAGLLTALSFFLGAEHVTAIEETGASALVPKMLKGLKLPFQKPNFNLVQGNSSTANVPPETSLVVSELFGNDPFQEGVLLTLRNFGNKLSETQQKGKFEKPTQSAKQVHAAKPEQSTQSSQAPQYIPQSVEVFAEIRQLKGSPVFDRVKSWCKFRFNAFQSLENSESNNFSKRFLQTAGQSFQWSSLSFPVSLNKSDLGPLLNATSLATISLVPPIPAHVQVSGSFELKDDFLEDTSAPWVVLLWFRAVLFEDITVSNHPEQQDFCNHWSPIVIPLAFPPVSSLKGAQKSESAHLLKVKYWLADAEDSFHLKVVHSSGNVLAQK